MTIRKDTSITIRKNKENKEEAQEILFSFDKKKRISNDGTLEAINEVEQMKKNSSFGKAYTDVDEMMKDLLA